MDWRIRPATRRDVTALLDIERAQFPEPWTRGMLLDEITNVATRRYRVAVEGRRIVGYLGAMFVLDEGHLNTVATTPGEEGRGIARSLMADFIDAARSRGVRRVSLEVAVSNERAQALYRSLGFSPVGLRRRYYERTGEDALVCWLELDESPAPPPTVVP